MKLTFGMTLFLVRHFVIMESRMTTWAMATLVLLGTFVLAAKAENFKVGEERGWVVPFSGLDYSVWAKDITAHVGDSLCNYEQLPPFFTGSECQCKSECST